MCGIFGYSFKQAVNVPWAKRAAMTALLQLGNDTRGGDSWGYYKVSKREPIVIQKGLSDIINVPSDEISSCKVMMAHTRKATTGGKKAENSHPFECGNIIGMHNGIIYNHEELNTKYKRQCVVDSQQIFHHLNDGLELGDLRGYGTIAWVDKSNPFRVFLCKLTTSGSLAVGQLKQDGVVCGIAWSSDQNHLTAAVRCTGMECKKFTIEEEIIYYVEDGVLFKTEKKLELEKNASSHGTADRYGHVHNYPGGGRYVDSDNFRNEKKGKKNTKSGPTAAEYTAFLARLEQMEEEEVTHDGDNLDDLVIDVVTPDNVDEFKTALDKINPAPADLTPNGQCGPIQQENTPPNINPHLLGWSERDD